MPYKKDSEGRAKNTAYQKKWYLTNKETHKARIRNQKKKIKLEFEEWKTKQKCSFCGESHPACIDFHHKEDKNYNISHLKHEGSPIKLKEELAKCIPLCSNCHRKLHYRENFTPLDYVI